MKADYLIADIGATNARFVRIDSGQNPDAGPLAASAARVVLPTAKYSKAESLLDAAKDALGVAAPAACCLAIAGPVTAGVHTITNLGLEFDEHSLSERLGCPLHIVNDFHALAKAVPRLTHLLQLGGDAAGTSEGVKAVLGPGSGLGMSVLLPLPDRAANGRLQWHVLDSEGGHADLAPGNPLESEVLTLLNQRRGSACWETVLSGPGLVNLYRCLCEIWGAEAQPLTAEDIARSGVAIDDPICHQTLELFFGWLGAAAGNLALTVCARGGVYIGGGIVPALASFAQASALRRRFDERCELADYVHPIPLYLILDEDPGIIGARVCLEEQLSIDLPLG